MSPADPQVILGNSNRRFSGVTSTLLQTLSEVKRQIPLAVLGQHHLPGDTPTLGFQEFVSLCRNLHPDGLPRLFHARRNDEMIQALIAKRLFGAKIKIAFTSTAQRQHTKFTKWLMCQMDGLITTCSGASAVLDKPADVLIPHGVDLEKYRPPESKSEAWRDLGLKGDYGIGIFGRVRPQKGIDILVDAAIPVLQKIPEPTIVITGETTPKFRAYEEQLKERIDEAGLQERIVFLGKQPQERLPELFQAMSIVTALSRNEGFGLTILEAMASGCAVLASHTGAWQDIIREGVDGYTVPCEDVSATTKKLELLCSDPTQLPTIGRSVRKRVEENYSIDKEASALVAYYNKLRSDNLVRN